MEYKEKGRFYKRSGKGSVKRQCGIRGKGKVLQEVREGKCKKTMWNTGKREGFTRGQGREV